MKLAQRIHKVKKMRSTAFECFIYSYW